MVQRLTISLMMLFTLVFGMIASADQEAAKQAALDSAEAWLQLVDEAKYSESWKQSSGYFRAAVKLEDWKQSMPSFRTPLGSVVSRKLKLQQYMTTLPGAPDGEYVVIQFDTSFSHKASAVETITPMLDKDGVWRVSGYYIK